MTTRRGSIIWLTGLSGAGKSTLAGELARRLQPVAPVEVLDGDEVRAQLSRGLGFSRDDRDTNVRRIGFVARLLSRHGVVVLVAAISPYADARNEIRQIAQVEGIPFVEVFVDCALDVVTQRDVKGLYKRALAGEIAHFTGVSDPYEPPQRPDVAVRTDRQTVEASVQAIWQALEARGVVASA